MKPSFKRSSSFKLPKIPDKGFMGADDAKKLGDLVIAEMKDLISKGISPIRKFGRFPEYKAVTGSKVLSKAATKASKSGDKVGAKVMREQSKDIKKRGYPYSVQKKFPEKGTRPVNLKLTGNMLAHLKADPVKGSMGLVPKISYSDAASNEKELGHRVGANGQPIRPTIPIDGEEPAVSLTRIIENALNDAIGKFYKKK